MDINYTKIVSKLHNELDKALLISAPIQWSYAVKYCNESMTEYDCTSYHKIWQYLLALKISTSMRPDSKYFIRSFYNLAQTNNYNRIFICGSADYSMLAHILKAYAIENRIPKITIFDSCRTPLEINNWYAQKNNIKINSLQGDILKFTSKTKYDVICTHSFIIWFTIEQQSRLIEKWYNMIRPGGVVITTLRLISGINNTLRVFNSREALKIKAKVRKKIIENKLPITIPANEIVNVAHDYAINRRKRYIVNSEKIYRKLFEKSGFKIEFMKIDNCDSNSQDYSSGPPRGDMGRLQIFARRM